MVKNDTSFSKFCSLYLKRTIEWFNSFYILILIWKRLFCLKCIYNCAKTFKRCAQTLNSYKVLRDLPNRFAVTINRIHDIEK